MKRRGCVTATLRDAYVVVGRRRCIARRVVSYNTCHTWHAVEKKTRRKRGKKREKKSGTRLVGLSVGRSVGRGLLEAEFNGV